MESGGNFEDYIRFLFCHLFGPVNHGQNWKGWERSGENGLIISDNQAFFTTSLPTFPILTMIHRTKQMTE